MFWYQFPFPSPVLKPGLCILAQTKYWSDTSASFENNNLIPFSTAQKIHDHIRLQWAWIQSESTPKWLCSKLSFLLSAPAPIGSEGNVTPGQQQRDTVAALFLCDVMKHIERPGVGAQMAIFIILFIYLFCLSKTQHWQDRKLRESFSVSGVFMTQDSPGGIKEKDSSTGNGKGGNRLFSFYRVSFKKVHVYCNFVY